MSSVTEITSAWAIQLPREDAGALAALRLTPGIEVAETSAHVWARGRAADETLARALKALPALERFEWLPPDRLRPLESRIAAASFPALLWGPIAKWSRLQPSPAALTADPPSRTRLQLVRTSRELPANLLLTDFAAWSQFVLGAGAARLAPLRFALNADGRVLVAGEPLPPLRGRRFVEQEQIATPAGFTWQPAVSVEVVKRLFNVGGDALVVWESDDSLLRLHSEQWVPATRAGVRATADALKEALP